MVFLNYTAGWQSGYAAACKAADAGSIPTPASSYKRLPNAQRIDRARVAKFGRRKGLKIPRVKTHAGSSPASGTIYKDSSIQVIKKYLTLKTHWLQCTPFKLSSASLTLFSG